MSVVCICLVYDSSVDGPPALQFKMPALLFVWVLFVLFLLFVDILSGGPKQN